MKSLSKQYTSELVRNAIALTTNSHDLNCIVSVQKCLTKHSSVPFRVSRFSETHLHPLQIRSHTRRRLRYEAKPFVSNVDHPSPYILFIRSQAIPNDQHLLDQRRLASSNLPLSVSYLCWLEQHSSSKLTQQSRTVP